MDQVLFYVAAAVAVVSSLVVIGQKNPIYSAFALIATLCSLAVIFGLALRSYLFDTAPADPLMLIGVALALGVAGTLGCLGPALRATRINPIAALRAE